MYSLIYRSVARDSFDIPLIYRMLSDSRDYNAEHGITGCLLYHRGRFLQLLEGDYEEVSSLFKRIVADERHSEVQLLEEEDTRERIFNEWSMAFQDMGTPAQSGKYKEILLHSYFAKSKMFTKPSKTGLALFSGVHEILQAG